MTALLGVPCAAWCRPGGLFVLSAACKVSLPLCVVPRRILVRGNAFTGSFPGQLSLLTSLTAFDARQNRLSGSISSQVSQLSNLAYVGPSVTAAGVRS